MKGILKGICISLASFIQTIIIILVSLAIASLIVKIANVTNGDSIFLIFISIFTIISFSIIIKGIAEIIKEVKKQ